MLNLAKGISQKELSKQLGVSASYLSQVKHGKRPASTKLLNLLNKQSYLQLTEPGGIRTHDPRIKSASADVLTGAAR